MAAPLSFRGAPTSPSISPSVSRRVARLAVQSLALSLALASPPPAASPAAPAAAAVAAAATAAPLLSAPQPPPPPPPPAAPTSAGGAAANETGPAARTSTRLVRREAGNSGGGVGGGEEVSPSGLVEEGERLSEVDLDAFILRENGAGDDDDHGDAEASHGSKWAWWKTWWKCHDSLVGKIVNMSINDSSISASSYWQNSDRFGLKTMWRSRLDNEDRPWLAEKADHNQWIQWNFTTLRTFTKIATKGDSQDLKWVKAYRLSYTEDGGKTWEWYPQIFRGNYGPDSLKENKINPVFNATAVRLHPFNWVGHIALRAELYGCAGATLFPDPAVQWQKCADEGHPCNCKGVVYYGFRRRQVGSCKGKLGRHGTCSGVWRRSTEKEFLYTDSTESILCNASMFKENSTGKLKASKEASEVQRSCGCLNKKFIEHAEDSPFCTTRRRGQEWKNKTTPGAARRRRLCGYGAVPCVWNTWSNFSACSQDKSGEMFKMRTRNVVQEPLNGGPCNLDHLKEKVTCKYPNVEILPACGGDCSMPVIVNDTTEEDSKSGRKSKAKAKKRHHALKPQVVDAG